MNDLDMRLSFSMFAVSCTLLGTSLVNGTCARNPHMTGLHRIQVVDHFKRWTYTNRKELEMWRIELLWSVLGTHAIRVSCCDWLILLECHAVIGYVFHT